MIIYTLNHLFVISQGLMWSEQNFDPRSMLPRSKFNLPTKQIQSDTLKIFNDASGNIFPYSLLFWSFLCFLLRLYVWNRYDDDEVRNGVKLNKFFSFFRVRSETRNKREWERKAEAVLMAVLWVVRIFILELFYSRLNGNTKKRC